MDRFVIFNYSLILTNWENTIGLKYKEAPVPKPVVF